VTVPQRRARPRASWLPGVVIGVLLIALAVVLAVERRGPGRAGRAVPVVNVGSLPAVRTVVGSWPTRSHEATQQARFVPGSRLRLARLDLNAKITAVNTVGNVMQIPRDPHTLGWWREGSAPGAATGTTVIVGHINFAGVSGALSVLPNARPGDPVVIRAGDRTLRYQVVAIRSYPKSTGIPAAVFSTTGRARLALITCGGPFDSATGNYEDNIVAYAEPA
jgi:hypothetical protein